MQNISELKCKVVLVGDGAVGKTSLIRRFVLDQFSDQYIQTIGAKVSKKVIALVPPNSPPVQVTMIIWDIVGQWKHQETNILFFKDHKPQKKFYLGAKGALVVCDITNAESLQNLNVWIRSLDDEVGRIPMVFLANKADLVARYHIIPADLKALADKFNSPAYITSAKSGENVIGAFSKLAELMYRSNPL